MRWAGPETRGRSQPCRCCGGVGRRWATHEQRGSQPSRPGPRGPVGLGLGGRSPCRVGLWAASPGALRGAWAEGWAAPPGERRAGLLPLSKQLTPVQSSGCVQKEEDTQLPVSVRPSLHPCIHPSVLPSTIHPSSGRSPAGRGGLGHCPGAASFSLTTLSSASLGVGGSLDRPALITGHSLPPAAQP